MSGLHSIEPFASGSGHDSLRELTPGECVELLARHRIGRLAIRDAQGVYVVPIAYAFAHGEVYAHAAPGRKLALMRRWPHVAFQVDDIEDVRCWRSVLLQGRFAEIAGDEDKQSARLILLSAFGGNLGLLTAGHGHRTTLAEAVLFTIRPETISGRALGC